MESFTMEVDENAPLLSFRMDDGCVFESNAPATGWARGIPHGLRCTAPRGDALVLDFRMIALDEAMGRGLY